MLNKYTDNVLSLVIGHFNIKINSAKIGHAKCKFAMKKINIFY